jgi:type IV secretion system protein VirB10
MVEGGAQIASSALSKGGSFLNLNSASSVATETLRNGATIPLTITVHQGEEIGITVARDLSFEKIYGLALTRGQR